MNHKPTLDIVFLPLYRDISEVIASEVYWALNTFEFIAKTYRTRAYVGRISDNGLKRLGKFSYNISSYRINSNRTIEADVSFYISILFSGLKNIFSTKIWFHFGSFGYMKGFNPAFLLPKFGKKYIIGPILFPTNDPPGIAVKLGFVKQEHAYSSFSSLFFRLLHIITLLRSDIIIFDSSDTKDLYTSKFKFVLNKELRIIPGGGISHKDFYKDVPTINHNGIILGVASNLIKRKNIDKLIEAMASSDLDMFLKIAGDGPERNYLISLTNKLNLKKKVEFIGRIDHSAMREFYNSIDIYAALDDGPSEAKVSVQEALMCGCAIISGESNIKGVAAKREWGYIVNPNSVSNISQVLRLILDNPHYFLKMKENAKRYADEHFSEEILLKKYQDIFESDP